MQTGILLHYKNPLRSLQELRLQSASAHTLNTLIPNMLFHLPHLASLACWFLLFSSGVAEVQNNSTGLVEIDLVFPRNETYNPSLLMPIVFSYRNIELVPLLRPIITYSIRRYSDFGGDSLFDEEEAPLVNHSSSDPYLKHSFYVSDFDTEDTWHLAFHVLWTSCVKNGEGSLGFDPYTVLQTNLTNVAIVFTTKGPSKQIDLVVATSNQTCAAPAGIAIDIASIDKTLYSTGEKEEDRCPWVTSPPTKAESCAVTIGTAAASSISASMTSAPRENPKEDYTRTGNWADYYCTDPLVRNTKDYSISERWRGLQADDALKDVIRVYKDTDRYNKVIFSDSIAQTFNFAQIPEEEDNTWLLVLIDLVTLGTATAAGPFFNSFLKRLPYFAANAATHDNIKDTTITLISPNAAIDVPWDVISDVKLVNGILSDREDSGDQREDLQAKIEKSFYGFTIPTLWRLFETYAFVLDSGYDCNKEYPAEDYLDKDTMDATSACYDGRRYYLVYPKDDSEECSCSYIHTHCETTCRNNKLSALPGLESLDGTLFGGITKEDLIKGSVRTYNKNGKKNVETDWDPTSDDSTFRDLIDVDITTPGLVRLPVCSPERAFQSWDATSKGSSPSYPCDIPPGKNECGDSTFVNETSDKSPLVKDCESIIKNIEGDGSTKWTTQVVGKNQRKIAAAGTCAFGVEATKVDGNVNFAFGGQDLIDIIHTSVEKYSKDGKIGATGDLHCSGNVKQQPVHWAIYHT
ncbi:hypothetical protein Neosp_011923 [[Neocosmospora] mangrovei]